MTRDESLLERWSIPESLANRTIHWASGLVAVVGLGGAAWMCRPIAMATPTVIAPRMASLPALKPDDGDVGQSGIWQRSLRGGFATGRAAAPAAPQPTRRPTPQPKPPKTDLGIRLVGTIVEDGNSIAIATDQSGRLSFQSEGNAFDLEPAGVTLRRITAADVTVSFEGQTLTMKVGERLRRDSNTMTNAVEGTMTGESSEEPRDDVRTEPIGPPDARPNDVDDVMEPAPATDDDPNWFDQEMSLDDELDMLNGF